MRPLTWVMQRPLIEGHYWCRCAGQLSGRLYTTVVRAYASKPGGPVDTIFWDGENFPLLQDSFHLWSDRPIPLPQE